MSPVAPAPPRTAPPAGWLPGGPPPPGGVPLFLLPPAGGSTALYRSAAWRALPDPVAACPVEPPGHGLRMAEGEPLHDLDALVALLDDRLRPPDGAPWAVLGHSLGALTAAAWALRAQRAGHPPVAVYLSAATPPWLRTDARDLAAADDAALWARLAALGGVPPRVAASPTARRLLTGVMRADVTAAAGWRPDLTTRLTCPVVAVAAAGDPAVDPATRHGWDRLTTGPFTPLALPGGHFYRAGLEDLAPVVASTWPG
ncbi:thioesterase domain-containing protein [Streptomyces sp. NPDC035033]|uniref:thioesterase II family protein n=1 Tax=Streptomyces sp. NPDC035033 TaxID=3155368 RepID=UPI0033CBE279